MTVRLVSDAKAMTLARGGNWYGRYGTTPCPLCQPEGRPGQNALTLADGDKGLLLHCKKTGCDFRHLAAVLGVGVAGADFSTRESANAERREAERQSDADRRARQARRLWDESVPIHGTIAETYLRGRNITCRLPYTLRFHPECWHGPSSRRIPAMLARVDGSAAFAVHRTYLRTDGTGKADVCTGTEKLMLGTCAGGSARLSDITGRLVVAEGIETALSLACGLLDAPASIWATLSTSGMAGLRLPDTPGRLTIAADGDKAGHIAALTLADRATHTGWQVSMMTPPAGNDFNDLLLGGNRT